MNPPLLQTVYLRRGETVGEHALWRARPAELASDAPEAEERAARYHACQTPLHPNRFGGRYRAWQDCWVGLCPHGFAFISDHGDPVWHATAQDILASWLGGAGLDCRTVWGLDCAAKPWPPPGPGFGECFQPAFQHRRRGPDTCPTLPIAHPTTCTRGSAVACYL